MEYMEQGEPFKMLESQNPSIDFTLALNHRFESNQPGLALLLFFNHLCLWGTGFPLSWNGRSMIVELWSFCDAFDILSQCLIWVQWQEGKYHL